MKVKDGSQIKRRRKQKHFSQDQLGMLCGKSQYAISLIERGKLVNITDDFANNLAKYLDREVEELFTEHSIADLPELTSEGKSDRQLVPA